MILLVFLLLLALSAFFSGSETAFFSIDRADRHKLQKQSTTTSKAILRLLDQPRDLLIAILFGNVLVNVVYFSVAASLAGRVGKVYPAAEPAIHIGALLAIIVFGEIVPKTISVGIPVTIARSSSAIMVIWQQASRLVTVPLGLIIGTLLKAYDRFVMPPGPLTNVEMARIVELQTERGELDASLSELLQDVLLLSQIRVREIMTPRVDIYCFDLSEGRERFLDLVSEFRRSKILVHRGEGLDDIYGVLNVKEVLKRPDEDLSALVEPVWFIPETKRLEGLLQEILTRDVSLAVVVDEYGGTSGLVTMEDVIEEVVGDISSRTRIPSVQRLGSNRYRVSGTTSIRDLNDLLSLNIDSEGVTTVAGLMARELGRIPKEGDGVEIVGGQLKVIRVDKHRTRQVDLELRDRG